MLLRGHTQLRTPPSTLARVHSAYGLCGLWSGPLPEEIRRAAMHPSQGGRVYFPGWLRVYEPDRCLGKMLLK
jgi:hypothetical protein